VSVASASRALSHGGVGADLQSRIEAAAKRLEYRTNLAARALVSRRSGLVGVLVSSVADPLFAEAVEALERRLRSAGYAVLLAGRASAGESSAPMLLRDSEAIVYVGTRPMSSEIELLGREAMPWVSVCDAPGAERTLIDVGRQRGGTLATRYLLDLGHRRFGVCSAAGPETRQGVAAALLGGGGTLVDAGEGNGGVNLAEGRTAVGTILDRDDLPTAIVCGSDLEALAAIRECTLRGIDVPGEISVVGFGDRELARHARPALTTVRVSAAAIGTHAGESVLAALRGEPTSLIEVPLKLVVRETTATVRL
jgi:LacI family transcriptional regulator